MLRPVRGDSRPTDLGSPWRTGATMTSETQFADLEREWRALVPSDVPNESAFASASTEAKDIRARGRWVSGPSDMLTILGRHRNELVHSRLLAWLLNPTGQHGLGDRFLRAFLESLWPGDDTLAPGVVEIELERARTGLNERTGLMVEARADLVIRLDAAVVVVENKVDAGEQPAQCERLYWSWVHDPTEVRWVYLTPTGRPPTTAASPEALAAWRTASYAQVTNSLSQVLDEASGSPGDLGRASARQYLATLVAQGNR